MRALTHHSTGPARKAAQAGEFKRYAAKTCVANFWESNAAETSLSLCKMRGLFPI
jgi:hypothetical protein